MMALNLKQVLHIQEAIPIHVVEYDQNLLITKAIQNLVLEIKYGITFVANTKPKL